VFWAWHIITVGEFENGQDPFRFGSLQFFACGGFHLLFSLLLDRFSMSGIREGAWCILFSGVVSTAFGFTAQVIGQRMSPNPSRAAIILTSESLFSLIGGVVWNLLPIASVYPVDAELGEFGLLGAALMFGAILLAGYRTDSEKELDKYPEGVYNRDSKEKGAERWKRWTVAPLVRKKPNGRVRKRKG
jgi:drug/metabolite transporter (DMT)-like permease